MAQKAVPFLSPVMRMVQGGPFEAQTKNMNGGPLTTMAGVPTQRYFLAGAVPKNDPNWPAFYNLLHQTAMQGFPSLFDPRTGQCLSQQFSMKVADGDDTSITKPGDTPNAQKEGFAGHWIVKFSSSFAPSVYYAGHYAPHEAITDPKVLNRGDYIRVSGSVQSNDNAQKPGIYVNLNMVEFAGKGVPIVSGPDAGAVFGAAAAQLPQGAQPLPMHGGNAQPMAGFQPPGMMQQPQGQAGYGVPYPGPSGAPGGQPSAMPTFAPTVQPSMMPAGAPGAGYSPPGVAVQPHPGILAGPGMTAPPGMMQQPAPQGQQFAPPGFQQPQPQFQQPGMGAPQFVPQMQQAPVVPQMTPKAGGWTYEQLRQQGYTDDVMRAQGLML